MNRITVLIADDLPPSRTRAPWRWAGVLKVGLRAEVRFPAT